MGGSMRGLLFVAVLAGATAVAAPAAADPITDPAALDDWATITLDFEDLAGDDGRSLGGSNGEPYGPRVRFGSARVREGANLASESGSIAIESTVIYSFGHKNAISVLFDRRPQRAVGLYVQDTLGTDLEVRVFGPDGRVTESLVLGPDSGTRYVGFVRPAADITRLQVLSAHDTFAGADGSRMLVDDLAFAEFADQDHDGVADEIDVCPGTTLPDGPTVELARNRYRVTAKGKFKAAPPKAPVYDIEETGGCNATQIVGAMGLSDEQLRYGLRRRALERWIARLG